MTFAAKVKSRKKEFESSATRPTPICVNPDGIPSELKRLAQWVTWSYKLAKGRWSKVPTKVGGGLASVTDSATWSTFAEALDWRLSHPDSTSGVGFVFTEADPYCGVDIDNCRDPATGTIETWASDLVKTFDSYTETSPSGTGLKIFIMATFTGSRNRFRYETGELEFYDHGRYFAVTGVAI